MAGTQLLLSEDNVWGVLATK